MSTANAENLLRQKASTARKERETREMTPARALRLGFARVAGQLWDLPMDVLGIEQSLCGLENVAALLGDDGLLMLLDGPDGTRGALALDCAVMAAMTEVQTIGVVSPKAPPDRTPTPTDAAMIVPWLDGALEHADVTLLQSVAEDAPSPHEWMVGYRFGAMAENARALALALDAPDLHCLRFQLDVGVGMRQGACTLLLPAVASPPAADTAQDKTPGEASRDTLMSVSAELRVIAARLSLTLAEANRLKPGDTLPIDAFLLTEAELQAEDGSSHGTARLGKVDGHWAIRLDGSDAGDAPRLSEPVPDRAEAEPHMMDGDMAEVVLQPKPAPKSAQAPEPPKPQLPATTENINFE